uniref:Putative carboxylesterase 17 n=1 Tax=Noccaea caerulescens TaxID=107243 RepID=A0A1J3JWF7_NOCCA
MAAISFSHNHQSSGNRRGGSHHHRHGPVVEEIEGLIKVFNDGCVERPPIVPTVSPTVHPSAKVTAFDIKLSNDTPTRVYIPDASVTLPLLVYFHGGGFCVGSAAWSCYHDFLTSLAVKARCVIVSVNYRLAPEHRLPAAYDDGVNVVSWLMKQQTSNGGHSWVRKCNLANVFLGGDSAGANIAYQVAVRITAGDKSVNNVNLKGVILIHPFFGGESRTSSERQQQHHSKSSALTLSASDTYWRLALPRGASRDHPWCNPLVSSSAGFLREAKLPTTMVFMAEFDILKDRNLEMCKVMRSHGKRVEDVVHGGVGHAFHILDNSSMSRDRIHDMMCRLHNFIHP